MTLAWDPVSDPDGNDIAYYDVRRDGTSVGHTSSTQLTVTGLAPGTSSQYEVQPVDADQRRPTSCTPITFAPPARQDQCPTPRPLGSGVSVGSFLYCQVAIAANPTDFAIAWSDSSGLYFQRFQPDGRPRSAKVLVTPGDGYTSWYGPGLVWNGNGYGIAWATNGAFSFAKLNGDGAMITAPVSLVTAASPSQFLNFPIGLAWNGSKYGAVWEDYRNNATTGSDVYAAIVNADGTVGMADIVVTNAAGNQRQPSIVWSPYAGRFVVAYGNEAPTTPDTIETVRIDPTAGTADLPSTVIAPPAGGAYRPSLACDGYYLGLTWQDTRTGGSQIFYDLLPPSGSSAYYLHILLTQKNNSGYNSHLVSAGAGAGSGNFDAVWNDTRDGTSRIYFQKVLYGYYPSDENVAVSPAAFGLQLPRLGISSTGMLVASPQVSPYGPGALYTLGCVSDATPPTCPTNLAAQVSGSTSVQLSWSAGSDTDSGVDRYVVVRNGIDVGQTTQTTFTDTVVAGATYAYSVQPVNWAGVRNTTCDQSVSATTAPIAGSCVQPTPGAPSQPLGGARVNHGNPIVWNGSSFATLWKDEGDGNLYFEKLYLDGRVIAGSKVTVATGLDTIVSYGPSMVWNGAGYGVAWYDDGTKLVWFQRLDTGGVPLGSPTQASSSAQTTTYYALESTIGLAWSGSGYAVVWNDGRSSGTSGADILATLLKSDGTIDGPSGVWHDIVVSSDPANQYLPVVIWSRFDGSGRYFVAWQDNTPGVPSSIYGARINPADGTVSARIPLVTTGNVFGAGEPTLLSAESSTTGLGLAWVDARDWDTSNAIYFVRLGVSGGRATGDVRISKDSINAYHPRLLWNGAEFGVLWNDSHTGVSEIWYDRIDGNGNPVSQPVQVTNGAEQHLPRGAWGGRASSSPRTRTTGTPAGPTSSPAWAAPSTRRRRAVPATCSSTTSPARRRPFPGARRGIPKAGSPSTCSTGRTSSSSEPPRRSTPTRGSPRRARTTT